jgi:hypothetical protein
MVVASAAAADATPSKPLSAGDLQLALATVHQLFEVSPMAPSGRSEVFVPDTDGRLCLADTLV